MDYLKAHLTLRVPVDAAYDGSAADDLPGRMVGAEVGGAELLGAVDGVWVDTRPDGGQALVVELDLHTAVQVGGLAELLALAFPADDPPTGLTWTCMVCGRLREDAAISVTHRRLAIDPDAYPDTRVNVRHCNDEASCISLAAVAPRWGAAPVAQAPQLETTFDGPCPLLTCTAEGPHAHPVCRSCGSVRYGNVSCAECAEKRPALERRETELGWFPGHVQEPADVKAHLLAPPPQGHGHIIVRRDEKAAERAHDAAHHDHEPADVRAHLAEPAPRGHGSSTPVPLDAGDAEDFHTGIHHGLDLLDAAAVDAAVEATLGGQC